MTSRAARGGVQGHQAAQGFHSSIWKISRSKTMFVERARLLVHLNVYNELSMNHGWLMMNN